jgi:predicted O-methyltransferase YrrM
MREEGFLRRDLAGQWTMDLTGHPGLLLARLLRAAPNAAVAMRNNRLIEGKVDFYQVAGLYLLARQYNRPECQFVDFGTMYGWSASMLSAAAPRATIHTLEPKREHRVKAKHNLRNKRNVIVHAYTSVDFQKQVKERGIQVSLVFVDGNHHKCEPDMGWWALVEPGGVMVFHDYTEKYPSVVTCVDDLVMSLSKRTPDVRLVNVKTGQGMVGVYKSKARPESPKEL